MPADAVAHVNANASLSTTFVLSSGASTCVRTGSHHCTVPASVTLLLARTPPSLNSHRLGRALLLFRSHSPVFSPRSSIMGKSVPWILRLLKPCSARFALVAPARTRLRYLLMIPRGTDAVCGTLHYSTPPALTRPSLSNFWHRSAPPTTQEGARVDDCSKPKSVSCVTCVSCHSPDAATPATCRGMFPCAMRRNCATCPKLERADARRRLIVRIWAIG